MLNITNHQGNVSQNHYELSFASPQVEWLLSKRQKITSAREDVEKSEPCTLLAECKVLQPLLVNRMEVPQDTRNRTTI
jgi:hypothetical protein